jgi:hypothetical protein
MLKTRKAKLALLLLASSALLTGCRLTSVDIYQSGSGYIVIPNVSSLPTSSSNSGTSSNSSESSGTSSHPASSSPASSQPGSSSDPTSSRPGSSSSEGGSSSASSQGGSSSSEAGSSQTSKSSTETNYQVETVQNDLTLSLTSPKSVVWTGSFTLKSNCADASKKRLFAIELPASLTEYVIFDKTVGTATIEGNAFFGESWAENIPVGVAALPTMKYTAKGVEAGTNRKAFETMKTIVLADSSKPVIKWAIA